MLLLQVNDVFAVGIKLPPPYDNKQVFTPIKPSSNLSNTCALLIQKENINMNCADYKFDCAVEIPYTNKI